MSDDDMARLNRANEALADSVCARRREAHEALESLLELMGDLSPARKRAAEQMREGIRREMAKRPLPSDALADLDLGPDWLDRLAGGR